MSARPHVDHPGAVVEDESSARSGEGGHPCLGCPAAARGLLHELVPSGARERCAFASHVIEPREQVPSEVLDRAAFAIVRRGHLIRERADAAGARTAIDAVGPGGCFSLDDAGAGGLPRATAYAVSRALICTCDDAAIESALEQGGSGALELYALGREAGLRVERLAAARARGSAPEQVAALLCALADLRPGHGQQPIASEFQQRDLAALLSLRHESVCRTLGDFEAQGLIAREDGDLVITDRARLEQVSGKPARNERTGARKSGRVDSRG